MPTKNNGEVTGWTGWVFFAGFMMIMLGIFQAIAGLTALINNQWLVVTEKNLLVLNFATWGWIHLLIGIVVLIAGFSVMHGSMWARIVGIIIAIISSVANLASVNVYPFWSIIMIVIDILVIYALTVHAGELKELQ